MTYISKNLNGKTFSLFNKYLVDLRKNVLDDKRHKLTPDSFLIFLDKIGSLLPVEGHNDIILVKM